MIELIIIEFVTLMIWMQSWFLFSVRRLTNQVIFLGGVVLGVCQLCSQPLSACTGVMAWRRWQKTGGLWRRCSGPQGLQEMWETCSACASWRGDHERSSVRMKRSACAGISASETSGQHPCKDGNQHIPTVPHSAWPLEGTPHRAPVLTCHS